MLGIGVSRRELAKLLMLEEHKLSPERSETKKGISKQNIG
jgi:hypothetical protein